jgi:hypothetical protein
MSSNEDTVGVSAESAAATSEPTAAAAAAGLAVDAAEPAAKKVKRNVALHVGYVGTAYTGMVALQHCSINGMQHQRQQVANRLLLVTSSEQASIQYQASGFCFQFITFESVRHHCTATQLHKQACAGDSRQLSTRQPDLQVYACA